MKRTLPSMLCLLMICVLGCERAPEPAPPGDQLPMEPAAKDRRQLKLAVLSNATSAFWTIAHAGIKKAEAELGVNVNLLMPPSGTVEEQTQYLENMVAQQYDAVAISPIDAENMVPLLNKVANKLALFCTDSDAPNSDRLAYVGTDNYLAGRKLGERLVELLPEGGEMALFVGTLDAQNARDRRQGLLDVIRESGIPIKELTCKLDEMDRARAKRNVEDVIASMKEVDMLIGLWSYNGPIIASALKNLGQQGRIRALCFDEDKETLRAVKEGIVEATVVQQPYVFGYQCVKLMVDYLEKGASVLPEGRVQDVPVLVVDSENVDEFSATLEAMLSGA